MPAQGALVGPAGLTNHFGAVPAAADWSTRSIAGGAGGVNDSTNPFQVATNIAALAASSITVPLAAVAAVLPITNAFAVWSTSGFLQTRATGNRITVLMASLFNSTGSNVAAVHISYLFTTNALVAEEVPGQRAYFSFSGAPNSWTAIANFSSASNGTLSATISNTWNNGTPLYLLFADDNGSDPLDTACQIDNFSVRTSGGSPAPPSVIITSPTNGQSFAAGAPFPVSVLAAGGVSNVSLYVDAGFAGADPLAPFGFTLSNLTVGAHSLVAQGSPASTSSVVNISILSNTPPTVAFTNPSDGTFYFVGTMITNVAAVASDPDGGVARVEFYLDGLLRLTDLNSPYTFDLCDLTAGAHTLAAVAVDNSSARGTNSIAITVTNPPNVRVLLANGTVWKYLDNGSDQGTAWRAAGFDDSAWPSGPAELGYGDGPARPESTMVGFGTNASAKFATTYFRKLFDVPNPAVLSNLVLNVLRDDRAAVYLNGTLIYKDFTNATYSYTNYFPGAAADDGVVYQSTNVPPGLLVAGLNVLAVEIHQDTPGSSDISFDVMLWSAPFGPDVRINEWMAVNTGALLDPADGLPEPWFEIYNAENSAVDLGGFYLSDSSGNVLKFLIPPGTIIPALGHLLYWADSQPGQGANHVNFTLTNRNGVILLSAPDGTLVDAITYGLAQANVSEGRAPDGAGQLVAFGQITPNAPNSAVPVIVAQPVTQSVAPGGTAIFSVSAAGDAPLSYQWRRKCRNLPGATNATLVVTNAQDDDHGEYSVTITGSATSVTSDDAWLLVNPDPAIALNITFTGTNTPITWPRREPQHHLQEAASLPAAWLRTTNAAIRSTATNITAIPPTTAPMQFFRLATSSVRIVTPPQGRCAQFGEEVTLTVAATGTSALTYRWLLNGVSLTNVSLTATSYTFTVDAPERYGAYQVFVGDSTDAIKSRPAVVRPCGPEDALADAFAARPLFTNQAASLHGRSYGASFQAGETNHAGQPGGKSLWLRWRAPATGVAEFNTEGSAFDTLLAVYVASGGSNVNNLAPIASDDDGSTNATSRVRFNASASVEYQIALDGLAKSEGFYALNWQLTPTANTLPVISVQPLDRIISSNASTTLSVIATGQPPLTVLSYQWFRNGESIPGAVSSSLALPSSTTRPGGYFVRVDNGVFQVDSRLALVQHADTNLQFRLVPKLRVDTICGFNPESGCCEVALTGGLGKPANALAPGSGAIVGSLSYGSSTPYSSCQSRIYWTWITNSFTSSSDVTFTATVKSAGTVKVSTLAVFNEYGVRAACETQSTTSTLKLTRPTTNAIYYIVLGFDSGSATGSVTYAQSQ